MVRASSNIHLALDYARLLATQLSAARTWLVDARERADTEKNRGVPDADLLIERIDNALRDVISFEDAVRELEDTHVPRTKKAHDSLSAAYLALVHETE